MTDIGGDAYRDSPVRRYVITGGRTQPSRVLRWETLLLAVPGAALSPTAPPEARELVALCREPLAVVEAAAYLNLPVSVVVIVAADLIESAHVRLFVSEPPVSDRPDPVLLEKVLSGLRRL